MKRSRRFGDTNDNDQNNIDKILIFFGILLLLGFLTFIICLVVIIADPDLFYAPGIIPEENKLDVSGL
jgi:hypothetical protein